MFIFSLTSSHILTVLFLLILLFYWIRATAIEMVTTLAHTQHGRQYLAQQGIMDKVSNMIRGAETDTFSGLYLPGKYVL